MSLPSVLVSVVAGLFGGVAAGIFGVAAVGKLAAVGPFQATLRSLSIPEPAAAGVAMGIIGAELATATLYAFIPSSWIALTTGTLLCVAFVASAIVARLRHLTVPCNCFGAATAYPLGLRTVLQAAGVLVIQWSAFASANVAAPLGGLAPSVVVTLMALIAARRLIHQIATEPGL